MIVYKVWMKKLGYWATPGIMPGGRGNTLGKIWPSPGYLRAAFINKFGSKARLEAWDGTDRYSDAEVVIYELVEKERVPIKEWIERTKKKL